MATSPAKVKATRREPQKPRTNRILVILGSLAILYFAREILIPLAFALILAFLLAPVVTAIEKLRLGRVPAVILTVIFATDLAGSVGWIIATQLVQVATELPRYQANIQGKIQALQAPGKGPLSRAAESLNAIADELSRTPAAANKPGMASPGGQPIPVQVVPPGTNQLTAIWSLVRPSLVRVAATGVVLIFTFFILIEKEDLRNRLLRLAGMGQLNLMTEALDDAGRRVSRYLSMQFLVNACFGLLIGIGLYFIGVPDAPLWGVVAGILRLVPYVGTLVAGALPLALSLAVFDHWLPPLLVFVLFAAIELVTGNLVEPLLYGVHTGISSLALLVTTVFWAALWGPAGLIMSTPLTVCLVVMGRHVPQLSFLFVLLGDEPALPPAALVYQRLLAMDQHDAKEIVETFLKRAPLDELYDSVLIPALSMAEQDRHRGAIDSTREEFLFLNINEMVAEFSEFAASPTAPIVILGRVLCLPAHDQADEIAAAMLAQLLEQRGFVAVCFPSGSELEGMMEVINPGPNDLICISALQPYAFTPARTLCKRLRGRLPDVRLIAGIWGFAGDRQKAMVRFDRTPPDQLFTTLAQVVEYVSLGAEAPDTRTS